MVPERTRGTWLASASFSLLLKPMLGMETLYSAYVNIAKIKGNRVKLSLYEYT